MLGERMMAYGLEGAGKTECWIDLAANTDGRFYVIDTDGSASYSIEQSGLQDKIDVMVWTASDPQGTSMNPSGNVKQYDTQWDAFVAASIAIRKSKPKPEDWIVVDRIDDAYEAVQSYWISNTRGDDDSTYWAQLRKEQLEAEKGTDRDFGGFTGKEWVNLKKIYRRTIYGLLAAPLCGKFVVAGAKPPFPQDKKFEDLTALYGDLMPAGESGQGKDFWLIFQVVQKINGDRSLFVRRTKRRTWVPDNPYLITNEEDMPAFYNEFYAKSWMQDGD